MEKIKKNKKLNPALLVPFTYLFVIYVYYSPQPISAWYEQDSNTIVGAYFLWKNEMFLKG
jgi:hypothetical protein